MNRYANFTIFDDVTIEVNEGVVTLSGKVTMPYKRDDIGKRVAKVEGVKEIRNRIGVLPVSQWDDELRYRIARAIYGNSNFWNYAIDGEPSDPHRRGARQGHAHRRRAEQRGSDARAVAGHQLQCLFGDERVEDGRRGPRVS